MIFKKCFLSGILSCFVFLGFCQSYEFVNQELTEILYGISIVENQSIIGDDTVTGKGSFRFYGSDFQQAFDSFLNANRLYVDKSKETWVVSKIRLIEEEGKYQFDCYDVSLEKIFEFLSEKSQFTIIASSVPTTKSSFHIRCDSIKELVELLVKNWENYSVFQEDKVIFVEKSLGKEANFDYSKISTSDSKLSIEKIDEKFFVNAKNVEFQEVLEFLSSEEQFQFLSLVEESKKINWAVFENQDFNEVLKSLCTIANISFVKNEDLYIFYSDYEKSDSLVNTKSWNNYELENISANDFLPLFQNRFKKIEVFPISESSVIINHSEEEKELISSFVSSLDVTKEKHLIKLNYISSKTFLENLPKEFATSDFYSTGLDSSLFFYGTKARFENLLLFIEEMDKPLEKLSYDLLIVQTQKSSVENWNSSLKASRLTSGNRTETSLILAPNFSFNLDLVQAFGYLFASELQASIQDNKTEIYADTTLFGVSGVPISFKNTNTFRYRDPYFNLENGNQIQSGITREIVSGLVLEILGTVSGNGTITTSVTASVSRRGADVANSSGNPPPTSEKVITTQVIGKSGDVIVLSGLVQKDSTFVEEKTPWISKIPFLGKLFSKDAENTENTEMIIYLVPHLEREEVENSETFFPFNSIIKFSNKFTEIIKAQLALENSFNESDVELSKETGAE